MKLPPIRKKWMLVTITVASTAGFFAFAIKPAVERTNILMRVVPEKQCALEQLKVKSRQYLALRSRLDGLDRQEGQSDPLTELDKITAQSGTSGNVAYMKKQSLPVDSKYNQTVAELRFENISLDQLVDFLLQARVSATPLHVQSLYIEKSRTNADLLNCTLQISTLTANQAA